MKRKPLVFGTLFLVLVGGGMLAQELGGAVPLAVSPTPEAEKPAVQERERGGKEPGVKLHPLRKIKDRLIDGSVCKWGTCYAASHSVCWLFVSNEGDMWCV